MAVPFISPVENIDELIEVLILIFLSRRHVGRVEDNELQGRIEDLMKVLMEDFERQQTPLANADGQMRQAIAVLVRQELRSLRTASTMRTRRRRTASESSCCEDKLDLDAAPHRDCAEHEQESVAVIRTRPVAAVASSSSSTSAAAAPYACSPWRLVRNSLGSMWTAVPLLCVVGWHLFQTYDC